ncbi:hypothetical protein ACN38_g5107 [Penicillium nordicum]|uniref:Uncharacterized protein n=1 Tax=Penicillium nordicum TaxID=229535 RepID=A0A0M8P2D3_9EURO|nr:hypothetical protein ACN38_g5107 [Penicillium nordicum]
METQPTPHPQPSSSPLFRTGDRISLQPTIRQYRMSLREIILNPGVGDINSIFNISVARSGGSARAYRVPADPPHSGIFPIGASTQSPRPKTPKTPAEECTSPGNSKEPWNDIE